MATKWLLDDVLTCQGDELELVLSKTPGPGESSEAVLMGKQLYFPQQETDVDLLRLLQPYKDVQVWLLGPGKRDPS